ncbi:type I phosphodiesterase/nucleotide pyrophosphatase [Roseimicrobium gellanilyticum]|uniref:Type I phosphodiesterase/nucleotide pyrophosphatase n=1 Tax=Roseimicrobium gellanilyticum TaxID=748857 RepID=A0A366HNW2_9BACT|nr:alkaline phosphatase PafA [Roseimicrobium gellanilyticum]RBP45051.1 type I phosphodiesterase/nucleotide pyrophosphatase [Roseimicrobium gellanilyticum]
MSSLKVFTAFSVLCLAHSVSLPGQEGPKGAAPNTAARPKLVVGIAIDQMRWDYLHRFSHQFGEGGFKRMLGEGFTCDSTFINHLPSATAVGHATVFTGSVPAIHGITGNDWRDQATGKNVYCVEDETVTTIGSQSDEGKMSPRNLLVTTVTDELRLATNFRSKVVGVSLKDRAAILPAGHSATAAYWFDDLSGGFVSSTYYMKEAPQWLTDFNGRNVGAELVKGDWHLAQPLDKYTQSSPDDVPWEGKSGKETAPVFPHEIAAAYRLKKEVIRTTPFGNTLTLLCAQAAVEGHQLGQGTDTDFLTINCASTDYVGHKYGPNSLEIEDVYYRLDRDLESFFAFLDGKVGKGNYLVFLTADHAVAHNIGFMQEHKLPAGDFNVTDAVKLVNEKVQKATGIEKVILGVDNSTISFDMKKIEEAAADFERIKTIAADVLRQFPGVLFVVDTSRAGEATVPEPLKTMIVNGYNSRRVGALQVILNSGWMRTGKTGTTHGAWNPYDTHIPLLFMGWGVKHGSSARVVHMQDIAPTVANLLRIQMPSGCVGESIVEVLER